MDSIGIDLHKRESQLCTITEDGELVEQRILTSRERFTAVLGIRPPAHILLEASNSHPTQCVAPRMRLRAGRLFSNTIAA